MTITKKKIKRAVSFPRKWKAKNFFPFYFYGTTPHTHLDLLGPQNPWRQHTLCRFGLSSFHSHHLTDNTSSDFQTQWHFRYFHIHALCRLFNFACVARNQTPSPCTLFTTPSFIHHILTTQRNVLCRLLFFFFFSVFFSVFVLPRNHRRSPPITTEISPV